MLHLQAPAAAPEAQPTPWFTAIESELAHRPDLQAKFRAYREQVNRQIIAGPAAQAERELPTEPGVWFNDKGDAWLVFRDLTDGLKAKYINITDGILGPVNWIRFQLPPGHWLPAEPAAAYRTGDTFLSAVNRVARDLPEQWELRIELELNGGCLILVNPDGDDVDFPSNHENMLDELNDALEYARSEAEAVCHCGMLMQDHHQGSSCTNPKSMGVPPAAADQMACDNCGNRFPLSDLNATSAHPEAAHVCDFCLAGIHMTALRSQLADIQGALADAGDVLAMREDGRYGESIREVIRQRDEAISEAESLTDVCNLRAGKCEQLEASLTAAADRVKVLEEALGKLRGYNVAIANNRINYRPTDHIQVIDEALPPTP